MQRAYIQVVDHVLSMVQKNCKYQAHVEALYTILDFEKVQTKEKLCL